MSFLLKSSALTALRASRALTTHRVLPIACKYALNHSVAQHRLYSDKKDTAEDGKKYQSVLNDDLLEKAGLNTEEKVEDTTQKPKEEGEKAKEHLEDEAEDDEFSKTKRRRNNTKSTLDKKKERYARLFWWSALGGTLAFGVYLSRDWDEKEEPEFYKAEENGYTPGKMLKRFRRRVSGVSEVFSEPAFNELLPPPPPDPYRHPLTLVVELDDTLVHSSWDRKKGWRTAKRPGVDYFLGYLSQYYEIVVFSKSSMAFAEGTITKLDPYHAFISYSLYREVCRVKDGKIMKDLSLMNRPLNKLIMIDPHGDCASLQPENNITLDEWKGTKDDRLVALIPFLEYLATQPVKDVRPVLASFKDKKKIPEEFAVREQRLRDEWNSEQKARQSNSFLANLLGIPPVLRYQKKMPLEVIREAGQKNYENMYNYLKENGEKMLKEEQEKTKEMLADQKLTLGKIVTEGMPTAEDIAKQQAAAAEKDAQKVQQ
ncbi:DEKNAAC102719 [Brettanomyces naardenensis]|uniref:Mitochondrial import inner membrane translocase subunit TIM50 n=1 Tax=Brettanomyces naardenensis TaxID=13370 RepID=A0A448YKN4_BRENA|nr:DEKNAAC102719 [Brettanomyces naardenensis]